jgi:hypothetical protein
VDSRRPPTANLTDKPTRSPTTKDHGDPATGTATRQSPTPNSRNTAESAPEITETHSPNTTLRIQAELPRDALPAQLVHMLLNHVGLTEEQVAEMDRAQAIERLNQFWTSGN